MRYLPCERCQHDADTCRVRERVALGVRGFNMASGQRLTSAKFTCERRLEGFGPGARVIVTDREWMPSDNFGGIEADDTEIHGTVVAHKGRKVEIWLDGETVRGNRYITIYPTPIGDSHLIGARPTGDCVDVDDALKDMVREARKQRGDHGDDFYFCPDCQGYFEMLDHPRSAEGHMLFRDTKCPDCGSKNAGSTEDFAERGLLPEQESAA